jgi:pyruvate dehydrogenase E1 component alpha subunit
MTGADSVVDRRAGHCGGLSGDEVEGLTAACRDMVRIRVFEDTIRREFAKGDMPGFVHTYIGAEAVAVGVCRALDPMDPITSTHRGHGHCLAKGVEIEPMVAELFGRESGLCHGRGGSMHIADFSKAMLGANAIVAGGVGLAVGAALSAQTLGDGRVAVAFFGDGATSQGVLHESMNLASIWKLPVVFVCENNGWAESTPASYAISVEDIALRAAGYSMPGVVVDGVDYIEVHAAAAQAVERARRGEGPSLIEAKLPRHGGHFVGDAEQYRDRAERRQARDRDPIEAAVSRLEACGIEIRAVIEAVRAETAAELAVALERARAADLPDPADGERYVYAD